MPLKRCTQDGQPGYSWGDASKCWTYTPGDSKSEGKAKQKAITQGYAIEGGKLPANPSAVKGAELSTDSRNALPDSKFAVPGKRQLPIDTAARVRNALARFSQTKGLTPDEKATAKSRIKAAAKKFGIEVSDDFSEWARFAEPLLVAGPGALFERPAEFGEVVRMPYCAVGEWAFRDSYGDVAIGPEDLDHIVEGFRKGARRQDLPLVVAGDNDPGLPLNEEHVQLQPGVDPDTYVGPGAIGWIKNLEREGETVYADVELNRLGEKLLADDRYRAVSPELFLSWTDPETDEDWGMVATGLAVTTAPRMKGLAKQGAPLVDGLAASEPHVLAFAELQDVHIDSAMGGMSTLYAYEKQRRLPLHSPAAVKGAKARFMTVQASESERDEAWGRLKTAAKQHGVDVPETWRALKASECAALLMQEADGMTDDDADLPPPCSHQPPFGCCPGYTRSDPDGDGDADCCAMAGKGCNGYLPLDLVRAMLPDTESASYGYSEPLKKGPTGGSTLTEDTKEQTAGAAAPETGAGVKASEPSSDQPKAPEPQKAEPQPEPVAASAPADFAELRNLYAAEKAAREQLAARVQASEASATEAREQVRRMEQATEMAKVSDRLDTLVRSGRVTPAEITVYRENIAHFAENDWMLKGLEQRPENSAVDLRERGRAGDDAGQLSDSGKLDLAAKAYMSERKQSGDPITYKAALLHVAKAGYQG